MVWPCLQSEHKLHCHTSSSSKSYLPPARFTMSSTQEIVAQTHWGRSKEWEAIDKARSITNNCKELKPDMNNTVIPVSPTVAYCLRQQSGCQAPAKDQRNFKNTGKFSRGRNLASPWRWVYVYLSIRLMILTSYHHKAGGNIINQL